MLCRAGRVRVGLRAIREEGQRSESCFGAAFDSKNAWQTSGRLGLQRGLVGKNTSSLKTPR